MAPPHGSNQPSELAPHNKLLGIVTVVLGFMVLALAIAFADAMKDLTRSATDEEPVSFWMWPQISLPGLTLGSAARDPWFYAGFMACFAWWWMLLGRPTYATNP